MQFNKKAVALVVSLSVEPVSQALGGEEDLLPRVSVASGYEQQQSHAAGSVTVITREDIEKMGATTLEQVLQTVPGLHVSTTRGFRSTFASRGIISQNNSDFLVKINNVPIRDPIFGGRPPAFSMPVRNILRIEVVRGPGSLIHGSDAIGGVVNIVTLTGRDLIVDPVSGFGTRIAGYGGSLGTVGGSVITGGKSENLEYALALEAETTQGNDRTVQRDAQTLIDQLLGLHASHAPGRVRQDKTQFHLQGEVDFGKALKLRGGFRAIENAGAGTGVFLALDPHGSITNRMGNFDLEYAAEPWPNIRSETLFSYQFRYLDMNLQALPSSVLFPQGLIQENRHTGHQFLLENTWLFGVFPNHTLYFGVGTIIDWLEDVKLRRNFVVDRLGQTISLPVLMEMRDMPDVDDVARDRRRRFQFYGFAQDEWSFSQDWSLTYGARVDSYSDEGVAVSPRLALIYHLSPRWTGKLLYNRAYHVPSFVEHGFKVGSLDPEVIDMVELAIERRSLHRSQFGASLFWYDLKDFIDEVPRPIAASGFGNFDLRGVGGEVWGVYKISDTLALNLSYAFQRAVELKSGHVFGLVPMHMAFAEVNFEFLPTWNLNFQAKWVGDRLRRPQDPRKPLSAYALISLNLRKELTRGFWIDFSIRNLLDADAREPSTDPLALPNDIPLPSRTFLGRLEIEF